MINSKMNMSHSKMRNKTYISPSIRMIIVTIMIEILMIVEPRLRMIES